MSWEHRLFIHATPRTSTGKAVPSQSSEGCSNLAIFQTTFPPSIHLSPAYGKLEIPGEGCSLCLWCGNDMEVQPLGATAATLLLQKIVLTLQILSNLWQEGNISEARSGLQMASWDITGACCLLSQNLCQPCTLSLQH